jgi:hypothetical protein
MPSAPCVEGGLALLLIKLCCKSIIYFRLKQNLHTHTLTNILEDFNTKNMVQLNEDLVDCFVEFTSNGVKLIDADESVNVEEDINIEDLCEWLEDDEGDSAEEDEFLALCSLIQKPPLENVIIDLQHNLIKSNAKPPSTQGADGIESALMKLQKSMRRTEQSRQKILRRKNNANEPTQTQLCV